MTVIRARFAPSPTGELHVGSVRTALLNWLFVRSSGPGARLLLRFDDTDRERSDAALEATILRDLSWLGLDFDDGPVRQSDRFARYAEALAELPVVRRDEAYEFEGRVIARADGSPLYHLATAVDDIDDDITHVLRGRDHLPNVDLQVALIRALGAEPPEYVHAPLLVMPGGEKVSKREGIAEFTVDGLRRAGYPASAIVNALALSLADFGTEEVMLTPADVASRFDLARLHSADSEFDVSKLRWISSQHIKELPSSELAGSLAEFGSGPLPEPAVEAARTDGHTFVECAEVARSLVDPPEPDVDARLAMDAPEGAHAFAALDALVPEWPPTLDEAREAFGSLRAGLRADGVSLASALHGLRSALTGRVQGPEFPYVLACVTSERWEAARSRLPRT